MTTELKEASVKVVLDTKDAIAQAEGYANEEALARARGEEKGQQKTPRGEGGRAAAPGAQPGRAGGGRDPGGFDPASVPGHAWDAGKATWNSGLESHVRNLGRSLPFGAGTAFAAAEFAEEYGPTAAGFASRLTGRKDPPELLAKMWERLNAVVSKVRAIDASVQTVKSAVEVQAQLWGGDVDTQQLGRFGRASFRVNTELERMRADRRMMERFALGQSLGVFSEDLADAMAEATRFSAGR